MKDLIWFQVACVLVLTLAYGLLLTGLERPTRAERMRQTALLALGSWLGEQTCISAYRFYEYRADWWLFLGDVPLLVVLIWPMVILSARAVVKALWPGGMAGTQALRVGFFVVLDASLMEVVATSSGLWRWAEEGYLGVPLIGILGWGFFAGTASWGLDACKRAWTWALIPLGAVIATHALLLAAWWGALRWGPRGSLPPEFILAFAGLAAGAAVAVSRVRARHRLDRRTAISRVAAFAVFLGLLLTVEQRTEPRWLWIHVALVAIPYLLAVRLGGAPKGGK
jgi:hypothetical protein